MGVVYAAQDERIAARVVALLLLTGPARELDDSGRRFLREARILEAAPPQHRDVLRHRGHERQTWFAMELLEGRTLSAYMGRNVEGAAAVLRAGLPGLDYLAQQSIVHRDLLARQRLHPRGGEQAHREDPDFGIAKWTESEDAARFHEDGLLMGKPYYWSPEQLGSLLRPEDGLPERHVRPRRDVLPAALTELPIKRDSPLAFASAHLTDTRPRLVAAPGNRAAAGAGPLVMRMLEKDRKARPQTYAEIIGILRSELGETVDELLGIEAPIAFPIATRRARSPWPCLRPTCARP
jgi:serine/threonine protein kinase